MKLRIDPPKLYPIGIAVMSIIGIVAILLYLEPLFNPASQDSNIQISKDIKPLKVPEQITAGTPFKYISEGEKLVDNSATVRRQLVCMNDGAQSIVNIDEIVSTTKAGKFRFEREMVIPISQRLISSDKCHLEFISTYNFYQVNRFGDEKSFQIQKPNRSNDFKLIVPKVSSQQDTLNTVVKIDEPYGMKVDKIEYIVAEPVQIATNNSSPSDMSNVAQSTVQPEKPKEEIKPTPVPWIYKVVSSSDIQLGVYNLPINAVRKYKYVNGSAKIYTREGEDVTISLVSSIK